jgi:hypothetical protein
MRPIVNSPLSVLKLQKAAPQRLRALGFNEAWLQKQIYDNPSLLGLGDVDVIQKEKIQPSGGRLDLLLADFENEARFEVEVMLGTVDESHIIRTIEYWDIERQRYPHLQHTAVIIAEEITSRFFNVIRLLNRAVPIMAIQLSAFQFGGNIVLQFIRVLDTADFGTGTDDSSEIESATTDRAYWEAKSKPLLAIADTFAGMLPPSEAQPKLTYNKGHIALATDGYNFCWLHPRKVAWNGVAVIKVGAEIRQEIVDELGEAGVEARLYGKNGIRMNIKLSEIETHRNLISSILAKGDAFSHG